MKLLLIVLLVLFVGSCGLTGKGNLIREAAVSRGTEVADQSLKNAFYALCYPQSMGAIVRWIDGNPKKAARYFGMCHPEFMSAIMGGLSDAE